MHESPYLSLVNLQFGNVKDRLELAMKEHTQLPAGLPSEIWHQILSIVRPLQK